MTAPVGEAADDAALDLVTVGEAMVQLTPTANRRLARTDTLALHSAGAEANVAVAVAFLGHRAGFVTRVGRDPFGDRVVGDLRRAGVDTRAVLRDADAPTGVYFKDPQPERTGMYYYRRGSAATGLGPDDAGSVIGAAAALHVTGITPALSSSCERLVRALLQQAPGAGVQVSFDVNHRPALWPAERAAGVLLDLARQAQTVFVGRDEAEALWKTRTPDDVRALLADVPAVVVKDAGAAAVAYTATGRTAVPALRVPVVEPVGAGDAFAAGYLSAVLREEPTVVALRWGHLLAAGALLSSADQVAPPPADLLAAARSADPGAWASGELCAHPYLQPEEVA